MTDQSASQTPIKVLMVCAMGMSSSLLEAKTKEAATSAGIPFELSAVGVSEITQWDPKVTWYDVILIAPQVFYKRAAIKASAEPHGIIVQAIEPTVFGMVDGDAVFRQVMDAVKARDAAKDKK